MISTVAICFVAAVVALSATALADRAPAPATRVNRASRLASLRTKSTLYIHEFATRAVDTELFYAETSNFNFELRPRGWFVYNFLDESVMRCKETGRDEHSVHMFCRRSKFIVTLDLHEEKMAINGRNGMPYMMDNIDYFEVPDVVTPEVSPDAPEVSPDSPEVSPEEPHPSPEAPQPSAEPVQA